MAKPQIVKKLNTIEDVASFCKRKGFVFPSGEIYGGLSGFWDYGPLGTELKTNIKSEWWKTFVRQRDDVVGIDAANINHQKVWQASGHVDAFGDLLVECRNCHERFRADTLVEDTLNISADGMKASEIDKLIQTKNIACSSCKKQQFTSAKSFNLLFKTFVGPVEGDKSIAYLRPETAQLMFTNFKTVLDSTRLKLPFGIAQMGRAYRNEIAPRDFIFRSREFEQMEIEFFAHPDKIDDCPEFSNISKKKFNVITSKEQAKKDSKVVQMTAQELVTNKLVKNKWHAYWLVKQYYWFIDLGLKPKNLRLREHLKEELAHYASSCFDIEYNFPFGWKELHGMADRGNFDLSQHIKHSGQNLNVFDEDTKKRVVPVVVAEPSQGVDRAFLAFLLDAYTIDKDRIVLKLHNNLVPIQIAVFPLVKKPQIVNLAKKVQAELRGKFTVVFDSSGNIGKSYRRMDESGTPFCITVDYDSLKKKDVTVRERDSMKQSRVKIDKLTDYLDKHF